MLIRLLLLQLLVLPGITLAQVTPDAKADWQMLRNKDADVDDRVTAGENILERAAKENSCSKTLPDLLDFVAKSNAPVYVRTRIADVMPKWCADPETIRLVASRLGQGKSDERAWTLHVSRGLKSPEIDKSVLLHGLPDEDPRNARYAIRILVEHAYSPAVPGMRSLLTSTQRQAVHASAVGAISALLKDSPDWTDWQARLVVLAQEKEDDLRRSGLAALSAVHDVTLLPLFLESLPHTDWSTRVLAVEYLAKSSSKSAVSAIIDQMKREKPDTRVMAACCAALESISGGLEFGERVEDWARWWQNNEATFEFKTVAAGEQKDVKRPRSGDGTHIPPEFYGIDVESQRVCFVIDVSGSMTQKPKDAGESAASRIEVAKRELNAIIDRLPPGAMFNIISFGSDVDAWLPGLEQWRSASMGDSGGKPTGHPKRNQKPNAGEASEADLRARAHAYVNALKAGSGTNIYDALETAFGDIDVDTICFMTDGTPTDGHEIDPDRIRKAVQEWNAGRRVRVNGIAIGTRSELTRQLAADSGGDFRFRE